MRRKRLQHAADTLCRIFCGWRLVNVYPELEQRGSGTIRIDALTGETWHNQAPLPAFAIAQELQHWLLRDLAAHNIPRAALQQATVTATLTFAQVPRETRVRADQHFGRGGRHLDPAIFLRCEIACRSRVATDEAVYEGVYHDTEEWPAGFPER